MLVNPFDLSTDDQYLEYWKEGVNHKIVYN